MKKLTSFAIIMIFVALSCKKADNSEPDVAPSNLTLNATVSADSSGNVSCVATATNATYYTYNYGDGKTEVTASGTVTHQYLATGTYTVTVVAKNKGTLSATTSKPVSVIVVKGMFWADEFSTAGPPDPTKWNYDLGGGGWGNNEAEYYTNRSDNVTVSDGTLKITLKKESYQGSEYTSARILTKGKFSFKYGKIEIRAKLPAGGGTWPAIWLLGDNLSSVGWPACGEIDIMEHVGNQLNRIFTTLHHPGHSGGNGDGGSLVIANATTEFHVYSLEWSPTVIKSFVDNVPIYTFTNSANLPFNQNFFIILNVAMGGNFGGAIDPAFTSGQMEIDYVRVSQ
jgi:beta-glucanase (GH16 family)